MKLDEHQQRVVDHDGSPLLVLGGPGTGKTAALEARYLRLASSEGLAPHRILMLTPSRVYSAEAKDRLMWALPHNASIEIPVHTWHALAYHLVTRYCRALGYREPPVLLTATEQWGVVREMLAREQRVDWPTWGERLTDRGFVDEIADFCLRVEQRMSGEEDDLNSILVRRPDWSEAVAFYRRYRDYLKEEARLDYSGLIAAAVRLLEGDADVRAALHARFPHVLIDDGQEMSPAHRRLLQSFDVTSLVVVADPDSSVETFRGSEPDWVFGFGKEFGPHETVLLPRSHRLGSPMLDQSLRLIAHNEPDSTHRPSTPAGHESVCEARIYPSTAEELDAIARELRRLHLLEDVAWNEMAVLLSQPSLLRQPLERALERWEVPHHAMAGERPLGSEPLVAAFLDLVRVSLRTEGWEEALPRLLTSPLIGLDYAELRRLERSAWEARGSFYDLVETAPEAREFAKLRDLVLEHRERADECFWNVYLESDYYRRLVSESSDEELDALVAFSHSVSRFVERRRGRGSIAEYLQEAARADFGGDSRQRAGLQQDKVSVLSFHAAHGREWHTVFVAGCLDAWIPKGKRARGLFDPFSLEVTDVSEREVEAIAADRRTFYVAATRGRRRTVLSSSPGSSGRGRPSRFVSELTGGAGSPADAGVVLPPLTLREFSARLRRQVARPDASRAQRAAAAMALAELPITQPENWYGRWDWTEHLQPLTARGEFRTSYSRLSAYENCGLQYVLQSVLGLDPESSHAMKFGSWIHNLFQAVHQRKINDIPDLKAAYRRMFDERIFPNAAIAERYRRDGEKMLRNFWEREFTQDNVIAEYAFEFPFEGATLRGRIDRIDTVGGKLKLTDYKTSRWAPGYKDAAESLQLAIYFLAARTDPELKKEGTAEVARLVYPGAARRDGSMSILSQNAEEADKVIARLPGLIESVLAEDFKPSPEADCFFCNMKPLCPLWPEGREVES